MPNPESSRKFRLAMNRNLADSLGYTHQECNIISYLYIKGGKYGNSLNRQVAAYFKITESTLKNHIQNIFNNTQSAFENNPEAYVRLCNAYEELNMTKPVPEVLLDQPLNRPKNVEYLLIALTALRVLTLKPTR